MKYRLLTRPRAKLHCGDAVKWLGGLGAETVDLLITDVAYESLEKHRARGTTPRLTSWFTIFPNDRFDDFFEAAYWALAKNAHLYFFCDAETLLFAKPAAERAGFTFWKPLVWDKKRIGMGYHYRARYEFVLFFEKGKRRLNDLGVSDVIEAPRIVNGYPTEKPVSVSEVLVKQSSKPGEVVADPFMGSGSVGAAALGLGRHFWGNDIDALAVDNARRRLGG